MARPLLRHVPTLPAVLVAFARNSIDEPSYGCDGFRLTAGLLACCLCYCISCRSHRKPVPWSPIAKAALILACDHLFGVIDGSSFTVMDRFGVLLPSRTPLTCPTATTATTKLSLFCLSMQRETEFCFFCEDVSMSSERTSSAPLFCSYDRIDRTCAPHPRTGAHARALVRQNTANGAVEPLASASLG